MLCWSTLGNHVYEISFDEVRLHAKSPGNGRKIDAAFGGSYYHDLIQK